MVATRFALLVILLCTSVSAGRDFYKVLGVPRNANDGQLSKAYRKLAKKWHPDRETDETKKAKAKDNFQVRLCSQTFLIFLYVH